MTRFRGDPKRISRVSDPGWEAVAAGFATIAPSVALRGDVIVRIGADAADGAAKACFIPSFAQIELDPALFPEEMPPEDIDPTRFTCRCKISVAHGAFTHECGHAAYTRWDPPKDQRGTQAADAAILLEEIRMECAVVDYRPADRRWLRACAREVILSEIPDCEDTATAARVAALILGRVDAGVLSEAETAPVRKAVLEVLGEESLATLEAIWQEALEVEDDDAEAMMALGRRWCESIAVDPEAPADQPEGGEGEGEGSGGPGGEPAGRSGPPGPLAAAVAAAVEVVIEATNEEINGPSDDGKAEERIAARAKAAAERKAVECKAALVFGGHGSTRSGKKVTFTPRPPTGQERGAANRIAAALRKAHHVERVRTVVDSEAPPGRLRVRGAMQADVQRARKQTITAKPWRQIKRHQVDNPPPRVALVVDISGSMGAAEEPISSAAWVVGEGIRRLGGLFAAAAFGDKVAPIVKPGQKPAVVNVFKANHGTEVFCSAVEVADGALGLSYAEGARLLVVVSDGQFYADGERSAGRSLLRRLLASGCGVLWLYPETGSSPGQFGGILSEPVPGVVIQSFPEDVTAASAIIGSAAVKAVEAARPRVAA